MASRRSPDRERLLALPQLALRVGVLWSVALASAAPAQDAAQATPCGMPFAAIVSPPDGAEVPREGVDPPCDRPGYCMWINVEGRISDCYWPYIGITPHETKPLFWILDPITRVDRTDGSFSLPVTLGRDRDGLDEKFDIFVIAHRQQNRFFADQSLFGVPPECRAKADKGAAAHCFVSEAVTVHRIK
jgi:hypothetical protein